MPPAERAIGAAALIAAAHDTTDRSISKIRWGAITELHDSGLSIEQIAAMLHITAGAVDLAIQSHQRLNTITPDAI